MIKVIYKGRIPALCGATEDNIEARTMADVLRHMRRRYPREAVAEAKRMLIVINGVSILSLGVYKAPLKDGDTVSFLPICGGG